MLRQQLFSVWLYVYKRYDTTIIMLLGKCRGGCFFIATTAGFFFTCTAFIILSKLYRSVLRAQTSVCKQCQSTIGKQQHYTKQNRKLTFVFHRTNVKKTAR